MRSGSSSQSAQQQTKQASNTKTKLSDSAGVCKPFRRVTKDCRKACHYIKSGECAELRARMSQLRSQFNLDLLTRALVELQQKLVSCGTILMSFVVCQQTHLSVCLSVCLLPVLTLILSPKQIPRHCRSSLVRVRERRQNSHFDAPN